MRITQEALKSFNVPKSDALLAWDNGVNIDPTENISDNPGLLTQSSNNGGIIDENEAGLQPESASPSKADTEILNDIDSEKNLIDDKSDAFNDGAGGKLPNVHKVTVDSRKVTEYALNPNNLSGGSNKAKVFDSALGYNQSNAGQLMEQIQSKIPSSEAVLGNLDKYGQRFTVDIPITGPNGNTAIVRTGWILEPSSDIPRMTTLFVK